ncbi:MAG: flagellar basal body L-ring protein FlgH [Rhodospirillaceae bacterium]
MNATTRKFTTRLLRHTALVTLLTASVAGCNTLSRLSEVGDKPKTTQIQNPIAREDYKPVSMPMPAPKVAERNPNSLWRAGARAFFKDLRAKQVGDILTVKMTLSDNATLNNKTERDRADREGANVTNLLGLEGEITRYLPDQVQPGAIANFGNSHVTEGDGKITRSETINLTFAAVVTQVLPNGNLVVIGRQEINVNAELRELKVTGIVRPSDIDPDNTISHEKIAEMRVAYGGRGTLSDLQSPRWGMQLWDIVFPF